MAGGLERGSREVRLGGREVEPGIKESDESVWAVRPGEVTLVVEDEIYWRQINESDPPTNVLLFMSHM